MAESEGKKNMIGKALLVTVASVGLSTGLYASLISGSFQLEGTATVTGDSISWSSAGGANTAFLTDATGAYAAANNTYVNIASLMNPPQTVGQSFTDTAFITFPSTPSLGALDINFIFAGIDGSAGCSSSPPAAGQVCTPTISQNGSTVPGPFNMQNIAGANGPQSTITWAFSGDALSGNSVGGTWEGNFTSQENVPFQTLLSTLGSSGSATNTFSESTLVVSVSQVPEPGTLALGSFGLVLLSWSLTRLKKQKA